MSTVFNSAVHTVQFTGSPTSGTALGAHSGGDHHLTVPDPGLLLQGGQAEGRAQFGPDAGFRLALPGTPVHAAWALSGAGMPVPLDGLGARMEGGRLQLVVGALDTGEDPKALHLHKARTSASRSTTPVARGVGALVDALAPVRNLGQPHVPGRPGYTSVSWATPPVVRGLEALIDALALLRELGEPHELVLPFGSALRLVAALRIYADDPSGEALCRAEICGTQGDRALAWAAWGLEAEGVPGMLCRRAPDDWRGPARQGGEAEDLLVGDVDGPWLQIGTQAKATTPTHHAEVAMIHAAAGAASPDGSKNWARADWTARLMLETHRHGNLVAVHAKTPEGRAGTHLMWRSRAVAYVKQHGEAAPDLTQAEEQALARWVNQSDVRRRDALVGALRERAEGEKAQGRQQAQQVKQ